MLLKVKFGEEKSKGGLSFMFIYLKIYSLSLFSMKVLQKKKLEEHYRIRAELNGINFALTTVDVHI